MHSIRTLLPARGTLIVLGSLLAWTACKNGALTHIEIADSDEVVVEKGSLLEELVGSLGFDSFVSMDLTESAALQNQGVGPGGCHGDPVLGPDRSLPLLPVRKNVRLRSGC